MSFHNLIEDLKRHEGFRAKPYQDTVGKWTVGYGWNLEDKPISESLATHILMAHATEAEMECARMIPAWNTFLDEERKEVLANMCFNLGATRLAKFKKMLAAVNAGDYKEAAAQMRASLWYTQVGKRGEELANRMEMGPTL